MIPTGLAPANPEGEVRQVLRTLSDESGHCVVTSPPDGGLRDDGIPRVLRGGDRSCSHEWEARRPPELASNVRNSQLCLNLRTIHPLVARPSSESDLLAVAPEVVEHREPAVHFSRTPAAWNAPILTPMGSAAPMWLGPGPAEHNVGGRTARRAPTASGGVGLSRTKPSPLDRPVFIRKTLADANPGLPGPSADAHLLAGPRKAIE